MNAEKKSYNLSFLATYADVLLDGDSSCQVDGIAALAEAGETQLSFVSSPSYQQYLPDTRAACVILDRDSQHLFVGNKLISKDPYFTFALISELFFNKEKFSVDQKIHSSAVIADSAKIKGDVEIGPNVVIGANVNIAAGVCIGSGCCIGDDVKIGEGSIIYPNCSVYRGAVIGSNVIIHSQTVIGSDGFGFTKKDNGSGGWQKIYQLGSVVIGNDVELGSGVTIDRGAIGNTVIANGVKLDNQVHVAHNVAIGENTAIAAATAIAGSTVIGKRCTVAGAVGIVGHITIADDVHITAMTLVTRSINNPGSYSSGTPMNKTSVWRKNAARFNHLDRIAKVLGYGKK